MEITNLILADYAAVNERGKYTVVGAGFTEIAAQKFPCTHPLMFFLIRLKVTNADKGRNRLELLIKKEDKTLYRAELNIEVSGGSRGFKYIPITNRITNLKFHEKGEHTVEVWINGNLMRSEGLNLRQINPR